MTYGDYYKAQLEDAKVYQDFVVDAAWSMLGLAIVQYGSKLYQTTIGESRSGVEIKHDKKYCRTGNLWIECAEKATQREGAYVTSGIYRNDNTWIYAIGDYDTIFFFQKTILRALHESKKFRQLENNTRTSDGFLLPNKDAELWAGAILRPNAKEKIDRIRGDLARLAGELHDLVRSNPNQLSLFPIKKEA
jgi:hypothetical protein